MLQDKTPQSAAVLCKLFPVPYSKKKSGLNDTLKVKKKEDMIIIDPFIPYNMNFQMILMPKVNLAKILSEKSWTVKTILILSWL